MTTEIIVDIVTLKKNDCAFFDTQIILPHPVDDGNRQLPLFALNSSDLLTMPIGTDYLGQTFSLAVLIDVKVVEM